MQFFRPQNYCFFYTGFIFRDKTCFKKNIVTILKNCLEFYWFYSRLKGNIYYLIRGQIGTNLLNSWSRLCCSSSKLTFSVPPSPVYVNYLQMELTTSPLLSRGSRNPFKRLNYFSHIHCEIWISKFCSCLVTRWSNFNLKRG